MSCCGHHSSTSVIVIDEIDEKALPALLLVLFGTSHRNLARIIEAAAAATGPPFMVEDRSDRILTLFTTLKVAPIMAAAAAGILITTRDRQLLVAHEVDEEHILDLDVLNNDEALQFFSVKAFKSHRPVGDYVELSERVLKDRDYVAKILEGCGFSPVIGIEVLIEKSRLTVDGRNKLQMHDLLQELGQLIVTRQFPEEPGKRSRIWREEEVPLSIEHLSGLVQLTLKG
ncbi:hypothetical protein WN943_009530 [Citrus x changshan-huyou]